MPKLLLESLLCTLTLHLRCLGCEFGLATAAVQSSALLIPRHLNPASFPDVPQRVETEMLVRQVGIWRYTSKAKRP